MSLAHVIKNNSTLHSLKWMGTLEPACSVSYQPPLICCASFLAALMVTCCTSTSSRARDLLSQSTFPEGA